MASIRTRKGKHKTTYRVVYYYFTKDGEKKQKWESFDTLAAAKARRAEVEKDQYEGNFVEPQDITVEEYFTEFVSSYGRVKWGVNTYEHSVGLIRNYINPLIGQKKLQEITARVADRFYNDLRQMTAAGNMFVKPTHKVTDSTVERVHRLMKTAFSQAVTWEIIKKNPFLSCNVEKVDYNQREIWKIDTIKHALECCTDCRDNRLYIAISLAFACSLRLGEILGLTWDNVHISQALIARDDAYVEVKQILNRVNRKAMEATSQKGVYFTFPPNLKENCRTVLVLKKPKTKTSIRKVWLPKTLASILAEWKAAQALDREVLGSEYTDYNLVLSLSDGRPMEGNVLNKHFKKLIARYDLPVVDFHSLRHSSTTYKLIASHGDIKAVQGDTGHATEGMVTGWYGRILDEGRKVNAQRFEQQFYQTDRVDFKGIIAGSETSGVDLTQLQDLATLVKEKPELLTLLNALAATGTP